MRIEQATTGGPSASSVPILRSDTGDTSVTSARVTAASENAFNLTFTLDRPGTLNFLVLYSSLVARYVDTYVAFDNTAPTDAALLLASDLAAFSDGVVARGSCAVANAGNATSCRIGPVMAGDTSDTFACSPAASCHVQNNCFGALCDYSQYGIVANSTYKVRASCARLAQVCAGTGCMEAFLVPAARSLRPLPYAPSQPPRKSTDSQIHAMRPLHCSSCWWCRRAQMAAPLGKRAWWAYSVRHRLKAHPRRPMTCASTQ
jgi:hypothetical protein